MDPLNPFYATLKRRCREAFLGQGSNPVSTLNSFVGDDNNSSMGMRRQSTSTNLGPSSSLRRLPGDVDMGIQDTEQFPCDIETIWKVRFLLEKALEDCNKHRSAPAALVSVTGVSPVRGQFTKFLPLADEAADMSLKIPLKVVDP